MAIDVCPWCHDDPAPDQPFQAPEKESKEILRRSRGGMALDMSGRRVRTDLFWVLSELPTFTPLGLRSPDGKGEHSLTVRFDEVTE